MKHPGSIRNATVGLVLGLALGSPACKESPKASRPEPTIAAKPSPSIVELTPAERAFLDGRLGRAIELLRAEQRDSSDGLLLGYALALTGDEPAAKQVLDDTLRAPHFSDDHLFRGLLAVLTGRLDESIAEIALAGPTPERRFFPRVLHVELLTLAGRFQDSEAEAAELAREFPNEPLVHHTRGHLESARENWAAAIDAYVRSEKLGGPNPDLDDGIAAARIGLKQYAEAAASIERCRKDFPDYPEILFQAIRLARMKPGASREPLQKLVTEYRSRTKRADRLMEIEQWAKKP